MPQNNLKSELLDYNYVPVIKESDTYYGGCQMWFSNEHWSSKDYIINKYGCGTIATADFFLYLALQNNSLKTPETEIATRGSDQVLYENYDLYVRKINSQYTKTKRIIAVLGNTIASVINKYSDFYGFGYQAFWKLKLTYYDMLDMMEEMLSQDIPVILSIGPNTPNIWGKKGVPFYQIREIDYKACEDNIEKTEASSESAQSYEGEVTSEVKESSVTKKPYYYKVAIPCVNSHYVTVTSVIKDDVAERIMLRISSWGKQYYISYEEYRIYIEDFGGTFTSSMVQVKKVH